MRWFVVDVWKIYVSKYGSATFLDGVCVCAARRLTLPVGRAAGSGRVVYGNFHYCVVQARRTDIAMWAELQISYILVYRDICVGYLLSTVWPAS